MELNFFISEFEHKAYKESRRNKKPTIDDELWEYIKFFFGFSIPFKSVCENHVAPFKFIADIFFERVTNVLGFASRASGKTRNISILHILNSHFKPGCDTCTVGAIELQAQRCYQYLLEFTHPKTGQFSDVIESSRIGDTVFSNRSRIEVLPATIRSINCITGDTLIDCPRDLNKYRKGIPIKDLIGKEFYTYSFNVKKEEVELKKAFNVHCSGKKIPVYEIKFSWKTKGKKSKNKIGSIKTTGQHLFLLKGGIYKKAECLEIGDRLEPFVFKWHGKENIIGRKQYTRLIKVRNKYLSEQWLKKQVEKLNKSFNQIGRECGVSHSIISKFAKRYKIKRNYSNIENHKVISVKFYGYEDVYDMSVEDNNNFVANGIFIHNSPHPQKAFLDEVELTDWDIYQEFLNMSHSSEEIKAQNILISSRKYLTGTMQRILDSGKFTVYSWCVFEVAEKCIKNNCIECKKIIKGDRSFYDVCRGRMRQSEGFVKRDDIINRFLTLDKNTWDSQQECLSPEVEGLVHSWFSGGEEIARDNLLDDIYECIDWGGTDPFVCLWFQKVGENFYFLDEIYKSNIAVTDFLEVVKAKRFTEGYNVIDTYVDPSGKDCRNEFEKGGIYTSVYPHDIEYGIQIVRSLGENGKIKISPKCKNLIEELSEYRLDNTKEGRVKYLGRHHACDAMRYGIVGILQKREPNIWILEE